MSPALDSMLLVLLVLCRVGSCLMFVPGFSSARVPMRVRLFIAVGISGALAPIVSGQTSVSVLQPDAALARMIVLETGFGIFLGLLCRFMFAALEVMGEAISMAIGISNNLGVGLETGETMPTLASLISLVASLLVLVLDLHWEILRGLVNSYEILPLGLQMDFRTSLVQLVDMAGLAFVTALRIAGPFLIFSLIVNFAFGLVNKMIPQIPIYFVSMPFVMAGGLWLFYAVSKSAFQVFIVMFSLWLAKF